jgi:hypothetical protein
VLQICPPLKKTFAINFASTYFGHGQDKILVFYIKRGEKEGQLRSLIKTIYREKNLK